MIRLACEDRFPDQGTNWNLDDNQANFRRAGVPEAVCTAWWIHDNVARFNHEALSINNHHPATRQEDVNLLIVLGMGVLADIASRRHNRQVDEIDRFAATRIQYALGQDEPIATVRPGLHQGRAIKRETHGHNKVTLSPRLPVRIKF
jgi:hypothetical protein